MKELALLRPVPQRVQLGLGAPAQLLRVVGALRQVGVALQDLVDEFTQLTP
jgi:hypothetical protein